MFTGIDEVDWASLGHAYGPADDVPGLLRGLASPDPVEREAALDAMYAAVHHQGDVYDSTLACIPFLLELVASPEVQDRGAVLELLTSIGGIELDGDDEPDPDEEEFEEAANYAMAAAAVAAGADVFVGLLSDDDPGVRLAAPCALAMLHGEPARVLALLRDRLEAEPDTEVRLALVEAVGRIALRHAGLRAEAVHWLTGLLAPVHPPCLRLSALTQLARCGPESLPADVAATATALLREADEPGSAGEGCGTDDLLRTLHSALGDRVDERIALLVGRLSSGDPAQRTDAVWMCHALMRTWRGPYEELVRCVGAQLGDPEPRLRAAAASLLESLFGLALPAADALAARIAGVNGSRGGRRGGGLDVGRNGDADVAARDERVLIALARLGDPRAVPALAVALEEPELPRKVAFAVPYLGAAAAPLAPVLRRRLGEAELDDGAVPLMIALGVLRAAEALPEVLRMLRSARERGGEWVTESALRALTAFGPAALPAAPELRELLGSPSPSVAAAAARALWAVSGDAGAVLPPLRELVAADGPDARRSAAAALGFLGPRASAAAPALRDLLASRERWLRMDAAIALWRVTGDTRDALPVLLSAWEENRYGRVEVAECLAEMGPAASPAAPLLRAELSRPRRHNVLDGGSGSHDIEQDERLLTLCRRALAAGV
ncbi:HEAT repeat domain-containing protein [Streptomyces sp. NPDC059909]|uniref:HEAT repeat domain-containing protein n=1 Tax=Streptomyces sp. NPDC059909 TaxID=3346998 RepID=UPI00364B2DB6